MRILTLNLYLLFLAIPFFSNCQNNNTKIVKTSSSIAPSQNSSGGTSQEEEIHEYNLQGRLVSITKKMTSGFNMISYTEYDTMGNVLLSRSSMNGKSSDYTSNAYDSHHNLVLSKVQKPFNKSNDTLITQYLYTYDKDGNARGFKLENRDTFSVITIQTSNKTKTITEEPFIKMEFPWK